MSIETVLMLLRIAAAALIIALLIALAPYIPTANANPKDHGYKVHSGKDLVHDFKKETHDHKPKDNTSNGDVLRIWSVEQLKERDKRK